MFKQFYKMLLLTSFIFGLNLQAMNDGEVNVVVVPRRRKSDIAKFIGGAVIGAAAIGALAVLASAAKNDDNDDLEYDDYSDSYFCTSDQAAKNKEEPDKCFEDCVKKHPVTVAGIACGALVGLVAILASTNPIQIHY